MNKTGREIAIVFMIAELMLIARRAQSNQSSASVIMISSTELYPSEAISKRPTMIQSVNPSAIAPRRYAVSDGTSYHQAVGVAAVMHSETDNLESHIESLLADSSGGQQKVDSDGASGSPEQAQNGGESWLSLLTGRGQKDQQTNALIDAVANLEVEPQFSARRTDSAGAKQYVSNQLKAPTPVVGGSSDPPKRHSNRRNVPCFFNAITCY